MTKVPVPIYQELLDAYPDVTEKEMHYGTIHDKETVVFKGTYPGKFPKWGAKFSLELAHGVEKDFHALTSNCPTAFFIQERIFDKFLLDSGLHTDIKEYGEKIVKIEENLAQLRVKELNSALTADDNVAKTSFEKKLNSHKLSLEDSKAKVYTLYEQFMGESRTQSFNRVVAKVLLLETEHKRHEFDLVAEAYEKDQNGNPKMDSPRPELDADDDSEAGATHVLVWKYVERKFVEKGTYVRDEVAFEKARRLHRIEVMGNKYYVAEAQKQFCHSNLRIPGNRHGITARIMLGLIMNISEHMYLLPTVKEHASHVNDPEVSYGNIPFREIDVCLMLKRTMPKAVLETYEAKRTDSSPLEKDSSKLAVELDKILEALPVDVKKKSGGGDQKPAAKGSGGGAKKGNHPHAKGKKYCNRCKNGGEKEHVIHSHHTDSCDRYHADGKKKARTPHKQVHNHEDLEHTPRNRSHKKKKREKKSSKKSRKRKDSKKSKKRRRSRSSSVSSSSCSSGEVSSDSDSTSY